MIPGEPTDIEAIELAAKAGIECDTARIYRVDKTSFLIIGFNRRSTGEWLRNGEPWDFDYVEEKTVANGRTMAELLASAKEYARLCGMTMREWLEEEVGIQFSDEEWPEDLDDNKATR